MAHRHLAIFRTWVKPYRAYNSRANVSRSAGPGTLPGPALQPAFQPPLPGPPAGQARQHLRVLDPNGL